MSTITQAEFERALAIKYGVSNRDAKEIMEDLGELIYEGLKADSVVVLRGIGRLKINETPARPARKGRNPATGEEMMFKAKPKGKKLKVLPNKAFKDRLKVK